MNRLVGLMALAAVVSMVASGCGIDTESTAPLQCPAPGSNEAKEAPTQMKVSTRRINDEIVVGDKARLQVEPGAGLGGNIIVCGRRATLILRDTVIRAAVLGQESALLVLQDDVEVPQDLSMTGATTSTLRCNMDKDVAGREPCNNFFIP